MKRCKCLANRALPESSLILLLISGLGGVGRKSGRASSDDGLILVQAPFYLIMGIIWIFPLKPLIRWVQTGVPEPRQSEELNQLY